MKHTKKAANANAKKKKKERERERERERSDFYTGVFKVKIIYEIYVI